MIVRSMENLGGSPQELQYHGTQSNEMHIDIHCEQESCVNGIPNRSLRETMVNKREEKPRRLHEPQYGAPRASVQDVARAAGVSLVTAQRVFGNSRKVAEATRRRVLAAAQDIGYTPSLIGRALSTGRVSTVAFVMTSRHHLQGEFVARMFAGLQEKMYHHGIDILVPIVPPGEDSAAFMSRLAASGKCDGVAVNFDTIDQVNLEALPRIPVPVVLLNYIFAKRRIPPPISAVGYDNVAGMKKIVRYVIELGHRRIAYLGGTPGWWESGAREKGFREAMAEAGLSVQEEWVVPCVFGNGPPSASLGFDQVYSARAKKPTAVVCAHDGFAQGATLAALRWKRKVPEDISITGFYDSAGAQFHRPPLTTVRHSGFEIGLAAGDLLLRRYENRQLTPEQVVLQTELVIRESTTPPSAR
jgi:LacI family transcriptional regulator